jgi:hypothetical protein
MISETALRDFKEIYSQEFGEEISDKQATELGVNFLTIFDKVYRPVKKSWLDDVSGEDKKLQKSKLQNNDTKNYNQRVSVQ